MRLEKVSEFVWEIPCSEKQGMNVPALIFGTKKLIDSMDEGVFEQITNVACLPGIVKAALCMPDGHRGYGFPIGGVAAFDTKNGVISPGGIGFDINCGVRLIRTNLTAGEVKPEIRRLIDRLFDAVPTGVGAKGTFRLSQDEFEEMNVKGVKWCIERGLAWNEDMDKVESGGCIQGGNPSVISRRALERGINQLGTLGSGNHYLEIQTVREGDIFDREAAKTFDIFEGQIVIMIHCGSRGFGHQVATDYLKSFDTFMDKYKITLRDRELAYAPFNSAEGRSYYKAMACAANAAFVNRQIITHRVREVFGDLFGKSPETLGMKVVYDVAHNIAKREKHRVDRKEVELLVHRKGATRSFGPETPDLPQAYRLVGQPVIIGGSMETGSYLLVGTNKALAETFGSTAHGSGRTMSRHGAKKRIKGKELLKRMDAEGIYVRTASMSGLAEEAGLAYKDIDDVVDAVDSAGISRKVVRFRPIGNIKG